MQSYTSDKSRTFYLTETTKERVKAWKKQVERSFSSFLPFEAFFRLLLEHEQEITKMITTKAQGDR